MYSFPHMFDYFQHRFVNDYMSFVVKAGLNLFNTWVENVPCNQAVQLPIVP